MLIKGEKWLGVRNHCDIVYEGYSIMFFDLVYSISGHCFITPQKYQ